MSTGVKDSILDAIGHTPLIKLNKISELHGIQCKLRKLKWTNKI